MNAGEWRQGRFDNDDEIRSNRERRSIDENRRNRKRKNQKTDFDVEVNGTFVVKRNKDANKTDFFSIVHSI